MTPSPIVLIAEDDPSVRLTLEFVLEDEGFEVLLAENGEEALALALERLPDIILLDQMMPKLDGHGVYTALRDSSATKEIPVLVLSGMGRETVNWPGAHFIGKPFSPEALVERIRELLGSN